MKLDFTVPDDGVWHRYCISCRAESVDQVKRDGRTKYHCNSCNKTNGRTLYFNEHEYWVDETHELWHRSSGVFVRNKEGKFLFFKRTEFPIKFTVPSGHIDKGESSEQSVSRELKEEVGIEGAPKLIATEDIRGDACSSGADVHRWSAFLMELGDYQKPVMLEEGEDIKWLSLDEALDLGLTVAVEHMVRTHRSLLEAQ